MKSQVAIMQDEKAPAIALLSVVLQRYRTEAFDWAPELLRAELESDLGIKVSDLQSDKIQAALIVLTTNMFESQWEVFKTVCHLFNNTPDTFEDTTPLEAEELAAALAQYALLVESDEVRQPFSDEVNAYAGVVFYHYGMSAPPAIFPTAVIPEEAVQADPTEKSQALSLIYDTRKEAITAYFMQATNPDVN